jgi:hypothetical protein
MEDEIYQFVDEVQHFVTGFSVKRAKINFFLMTPPPIPCLPAGL